MSGMALECIVHAVTWILEKMCSFAILSIINLAVFGVRLLGLGSRKQ